MGIEPSTGGLSTETLRDWEVCAGRRGLVLVLRAEVLVGDGDVGLIRIRSVLGPRKTGTVGMEIVRDIKVCVLKARIREGDGARGIDTIRLGHDGCQGVARVVTAGRAVTIMDGGDHLGIVLQGAFAPAQGSGDGTRQVQVPVKQKAGHSTGSTVGLKSQVLTQVEISERDACQMFGDGLRMY